jgi:cell division protein FtsL
VKGTEVVEGVLMEKVVVVSETVVLIVTCVVLVALGVVVIEIVPPLVTSIVLVK